MDNLGSFTTKNPILLLGCGKMGSAMLSGWLDQGLKTDAIHIVDPFLDHIKDFFPNLNATQLHENMEKLPEQLSPSFIIIAVKPQMMDQALTSLQAIELSNSVILSIAAGKTIHYFENKLGNQWPIIRAMPNTPAAIGKGISVLCANKHVSDENKNIANILLETVGSVQWIDNENLMDGVTALSGSGPAYVFYMVEAMAAAGEAIGLPQELSQTLARQTVSGAGALLDASDETVAKLRENVTSPGGTTAAALDVLMSDQGLVKVIRRAMTAAKDRSKELAN